MKRTLLSLLCCVASVSLAHGQQPVPRGYYTAIPAKGTGNLQAPSLTSPSLPLWTYNVTASAPLGGAAFTGSIVGRSPFSHGKTTTSINTQIVPLVITIADGTSTRVYDPTAVNPCVTPGSHTDVEAITSSPIFTNNPWVMNTVAIGTTQYIDANQRAQHWSLLAGTPYHTILAQSTLASQPLSFGSTVAQNFNRSGCGDGGAGTAVIGVVDITAFDNAVQALINGPLAAMVNAGTFPIFLTKNVVMADPGHNLFANCCILGYHSGFFVAGNLQIYSPFSFDTTGTFGNMDVSTLSHEMGEAINDPPGNNPTPHWGNVGQVQPGCQGNFEDGDPLSPGFPATVPPSSSNSFVVVGGNGLTYHLQELAFIGWFYGLPGLGTPTKFSNNSTFNGSAKLCPPGGTN